MSIAAKVRASLAAISLVVANHVVEMALFVATFIVIVLGKNGVIADTSFLSLVPIFFTIAFCFNTLSRARLFRVLYYLSLIPAVALAFLPVWGGWGATPQYIITVTVLCPIAILLCRRRVQNVDFVGDTLSYLYSALLAGGLSLIIFGLVSAINYSILYIFGFDVERVIGSVAQYSGQAIFLILCPAIFFALLAHFFATPRGGNRLFDIVLNYILTPALLIYTAILYIYFAKIVVLWELPKGGVAYMVFGFTIAALVARAMQSFVSKRLYDWYFHRFNYISIPALIMFWIGVLRRVDDFGLTESRVYLIACGAIMTLFLAAFSLRKMGSYYGLFSVVFVGFSLMAYVPAISASTIAIRTQFAAAVDLSRDLTAQSDPHTFRRLLSAIDYLDANQKELLKSLTVNNKAALLKIAPAEIRAILSAESLSSSTKIVLRNGTADFVIDDLSPYKSLIKSGSNTLSDVRYLPESEEVVVYSNNEILLKIPLRPLVESKLAEAGYSFDNLPAKSQLQELAPNLLILSNEDALLSLSEMTISGNTIASVAVEFVLIRK